MPITVLGGTGATGTGPGADHGASRRAFGETAINERRIRSAEPRTAEWAMPTSYTEYARSLADKVQR